MLQSIPPAVDVSPAERIRIDTRLALIERERVVLERIAARVIGLLDSLDDERDRLLSRVCQTEAVPAVEPEAQTVPVTVPVPEPKPEVAANDTSGVPTPIPVHATRPLYHALVASRLTGGRSGPVVPPPPDVRTGPTLIPAPPTVRTQRRDTASLVVR